MVRENKVCTVIANSLLTDSSIRQTPLQDRQDQKWQGPTLGCTTVTKLSVDGHLSKMDNAQSRRALCSEKIPQNGNVGDVPDSKLQTV